MDFSLVIYAIPFAAITAIYVWRQRRIEGRHRQTLEDTVAAGMTEPASLHPLINDSKCLGCGACVKACPETSHHDVLGLINGKAVLIGPTDCIGHGACKTACPFDAITLVFGTARRGLARRVQAWQARRGGARLGQARRGTAGEAR